jgi:hypothetical protein
MSDWLALLSLIAGLAILLACWSGDVIAWAREEWRLMRAKTWAPGATRITGPTTKEDAATRLLRRQRALAKRMRKKGRHLYAGKTYRPVLTSPAPTASQPPKVDRVVVQMRLTKSK